MPRHEAGRASGPHVQLDFTPRYWVEEGLELYIKGVKRRESRWEGA